MPVSLSYEDLMLDKLLLYPLSIMFFSNFTVLTRFLNSKFLLRLGWEKGIVYLLNYYSVLVFLNCLLTLLLVVVCIVTESDKWC